MSLLWDFSCAFLLQNRFWSKVHVWLLRQAIGPRCYEKFGIAHCISRGRICCPLVIVGNSGWFPRLISLVPKWMPLCIDKQITVQHKLGSYGIGVWNAVRHVRTKFRRTSHCEGYYHLVPVKLDRNTQYLSGDISVNTGQRKIARNC